MQTVSESQAIDGNPQYDKKKIAWWLEDVMLKALRYFPQKRKFISLCCYVISCVVLDSVLFHLYRIQEICQRSTASGNLVITESNISNTIDLV